MSLHARRCRAGVPTPAVRARQQGFTLLELTIAMAFVALLASGITLSLSTCLNVWQRSLEAADLNQEARAVMALLSRDLRGSYLGLDRMAGWFIGRPAAPSESSADTLELCTESSGPVRAALLPEEMRREWRPETHAPVSDYVVVRYHREAAREGAPAGLYRTTWVVPPALPRASEQWQLGPARAELISTAVVAMRFQYFDGQEWLDAWETTAQDRRLPWAVAVELTLCDARGHDHVYQTLVAIPTR